MERARLSKSEAYRRLCQLLSAKGFPLDYENEILRFTDQERRIGELLPERCKGNLSSKKWLRRVTLTAGSGKKIMVQSDPELNVRRERNQPLHAIQLIHDCGGLASLQHTPTWCG